MRGSSIYSQPRQSHAIFENAAKQRIFTRSKKWGRKMGVFRKLCNVHSLTNYLCQIKLKHGCLEQCTVLKKYIPRKVGLNRIYSFQKDANVSGFNMSMEKYLYNKIYE